MILYINTKDIKTVTVSLKEEGRVVATLTDYNDYGSQILLPLIVKLIEPRGSCLPAGRFDILDEIEVEEGPGSFTGLRVGASVAQALGFALNIPVNGNINKPLQLRYL